jgi:hypothetical protein
MAEKPRLAAVEGKVEGELTLESLIAASYGVRGGGKDISGP